jgi:hypothetical protein
LKCHGLLRFHDHQSIGRWERSEFPIDQTAEALIRLLAIEQLDLTVDGKTISPAKRTLHSVRRIKANCN